MHCPQCQQANPVGAKFCNECGAPLPRPCHACGQVNPPQAKFCSECGTPLSGDVAGTSPSRPALPPAPGLASRVATPPVSTPPHLVEKFLTAKSAMEGERKQVTVLFADLKGSLELLAERDPEEARQLIDPILEHMMAAVHRYEGTVNQVMGDGIMALFGAPLAHEDHAVRACYAALAMQTAMQRYAEEVRRTQGLTVQMRVGLNSGEVVVRAIGNDLHMDYSAVGQTTHLAARMEQLATPGSVWLTAATLRLVEGLVRVQALGPVPVKGLAEPVAVFELVGVTALRRRLQAAVARGLSPFVGRQPDVEALQQALARAEAGQGQVVALLGEPGVGKSRLVYEFLHSHRTPGWLILESSSVSYGKATAYLPVCDLLKAYCHIEDRDDLRTVRAKVTGHLLTLDENLQDTVPAVLALFEALPADSPFLALDPLQRRRRTLEALKRVLLRESQMQPLLLVFEDLHWIDSETQVVLDMLVESLPTARVLLLVNYRPEYQHGWGSKTYYTQRRRVLHARIVAALEALAGDRVDDQVERLAHHALRGEVWEQALSYGRQVGDKAQARTAYREAVGCYEQALVALAHVPASRAVTEQAIDLRLGLRPVLNALGAAPGRMLDHLRHAETLAQTLSDPLRLGQVCVNMGEIFWLAGEVDRGIDYCQRALAVAATLGHVGLQARVHMVLGRVYYDAGDYPRAVESLKRNVATLQGDLLAERFGGNGSIAVTSRAHLSLCHAEHGAEQAVAMGRPTYLVPAVTCLSEAYLLAGRLDEARTRAAQAYNLARQYQQRGTQAQALWLLVESTACQASPAGEPAAGHYRQALVLAEELGMRPLQAHCHRGLGTLYARQGQRQQARTALATAVEMYHAMDMIFWLPETEAARARMGDA